MTCRFNSRTASVDGNSFCPVCLFFCLANWLWSLAICIFNSVTSVPSEMSSCLRSRGLALTVWELALCLCALAKCLFFPLCATAGVALRTAEVYFSYAQAEGWLLVRHPNIPDRIVSEVVSQLCQQEYQGKAR